MPFRSGLWGSLLFVVSLFAFSSTADAGRRPFLFTWDAEALNTGDVEIESWLWARGLQENGNSAGWLWMSPVYGLADHVEIAFPFEIVTGPAGTRLSNFNAEARIRLYDPNDDNRRVRNLLRIFYQQNFNHPENNGFLPFTPWAGLNFVTQIGNPSGSHGTLDVGGYTALSFGHNKLIRQTVGLGYTQRLTDEWRLSAEYFHELNFGGAPATLSPNGHPSHHFFVGPAVAFSRGRVWATLGSLIGLTPASPRFMPRFMFAVAI
jgi:hypothetical protein